MESLISIGLTESNLSYDEMRRYFPIQQLLTRMYMHLWVELDNKYNT